MIDLYRLRTRAFRELILRLKRHAAARGQRLTDLYVAALTHLLTERSTFRAQGRSVQYFVAPRRERHLHLRIPRKLATLVVSAAREDAVPHDTFAYTALFSYEVSHVFSIPTHGVSFLFLLMKTEPMIPDRPIEGERRAMPSPLSPAQRLHRARTDLHNVQKLIEELWLRERMQYAAVYELQTVRRNLELESTALVGGKP